jgi:hypothetical protein
MNEFCSSPAFPYFLGAIVALGCCFVVGRQFEDSEAMFGLMFLGTVAWPILAVACAIYFPIWSINSHNGGVAR